eukprot:g1912.t1
MLNTGFQAAIHVWIDRDDLGAVMGGKGASFQQYRKEHNVRINVVKQDKYPGVKLAAETTTAAPPSLWAPILIQGGLRDAFCASRDIRRRVEEIDDVVVELALGEKALDLIFQAGVDGVKKLSADTQSRIYVPSHQEAAPCLVEGNLDDAEKASTALLRMAGMTVSVGSTKNRGHSEGGKGRGKGKGSNSGGAAGKKKSRRGNRGGGTGEGGEGSRGSGRSNKGNRRRGKNRSRKKSGGSSHVDSKN